MSVAYNGANNGRRHHFPQPDQRGRCAKKVRIGKSGPDVICDQSRDGSRHLHYACRVSGWCRVKSWSLEERDRHEKYCDEGEEV